MMTTSAALVDLLGCMQPPSSLTHLLHQFKSSGGQLAGIHAGGAGRGSRGASLPRQAGDVRPGTGKGAQPRDAACRLQESCPRRCSWARTERCKGGGAPRGRGGSKAPPPRRPRATCLQQLIRGGRCTEHVASSACLQAPPCKRSARAARLRGHTHRCCAAPGRAPPGAAASRGACAAWVERGWIDGWREMKSGALRTCERASSRSVPSQ